MDQVRHLAGHGLDPARGLEDALDLVLGPAGERSGLAQQQLRVAGDRRQRVVDLVVERADGLGHAAQPLGLEQAGVGLGQLAVGVARLSEQAGVAHRGRRLAGDQREHLEVVLVVAAGALVVLRGDHTDRAPLRQHRHAQPRAGRPADRGDPQRLGLGEHVSVEQSGLLAAQHVLGQAVREWARRHVRQPLVIVDAQRERDGPALRVVERDAEVDRVHDPAGLFVDAHREGVEVERRREGRADVVEHGELAVARAELFPPGELPAHVGQHGGEAFGRLHAAHGDPVDREGCRAGAQREEALGQAFATGPGEQRARVLAEQAGQVRLESLPGRQVPRRLVGALGLSAAHQQQDRIGQVFDQRRVGHRTSWVRSELSTGRGREFSTDPRRDNTKAPDLGIRGLAQIGVRST